MKWCHSSRIFFSARLGSMRGERLAKARKQADLRQVDLAVALGDRYDQSIISHVESGHSALLLDGAVIAVLKLGVSLDYLVGLMDDPTPSAELSIAEITPEIRQLPGARPGWEGDPGVGRWRLDPAA